MILTLAMLFVVSCEDKSKYAGDMSVIITESTQNYVWDDEIVISIDADNDEHIDKVKFYIDDVQKYEDNLAPFEYTINTSDWNCISYEIKVKVVYEDNSSTTESKVVQFIPCPIYESDLQNFTGVTETDCDGTVIGNVDAGDWGDSGGEFPEFSFGPAFPNPTPLYTTIRFKTQNNARTSVIVINNNFEIVDTIIAKEFLLTGEHTIQWAADENVNSIYRFIFHAEDGFHCHGDLIVE